jgi:hypothetical protein
LQTEEDSQAPDVEVGEASGREGGYHKPGPGGGGRACYLAS